MTAQEAIEILRNAAWLGSDADRERTEEAIEVALDMLDRQIPKRPKLLERIYPKTWVCPTCGTSVTSSLEYEAGAFGTMEKRVIECRCLYCGQVIDREVKV